MTWKILFLSSLLLVVQTVEIKKFCGVWTQVALFSPSTVYLSSFCMRFVFKTIDEQCICSDGKGATLMEISNLVKMGNRTMKITADTSPMLPINTPSDIALDTNCTCGNNTYNSRAAIRLIKENYFVLYDLKKNTQYTEEEPNEVYVFAKMVPKRTELDATLKSVEDLKNRTAMQTCSNEVNHTKAKKKQKEALQVKAI